MPELPEVETIKRGIHHLIGETITNLIVRHSMLRYPIDPTLGQKIIGKKIVNISRRAKYLLLELEDKSYLIIHLGMSGSITVINSVSLPQKHDHIDIIFNWKTLRYNDPRRFGCVLHTNNPFNHNLIKNLGPEPLDDIFNEQYLYERLKQKKYTIKQLIMDNQIVVGVGNIYACEALFLANIAPTRISNSLTINETTKLIYEIKQVLNFAIKLGGSSLRDYKHADGTLGYFQNSHNVYAKAGKNCKICNTIIEEIKIGQRNSFYCPTCQK